MAIITKKEFAHRCGVSIPTLYKWIEKDKDGLKDYVKPEGIDEAVFDAEQWQAFRSATPSQKQGQEQEIQHLKEKVEQLQKELDEKQKTIDILDRELQSKGQEIQHLHILMQTQLKALSAPQQKQRRTFLEWLGVKRKDGDQRKGEDS